MGLEVHQFGCLSDNYGFLIHDPESEKLQQLILLMQRPLMLLWKKNSGD